MHIIDSHIHLYADEYIEDREQLINAAAAGGVTSFLLPAIDSASHEAMLALEALYPGKCFAMMGLHPCYVNEKVHQELDEVERWLHQRNFIAIGEIGLDYYWDTKFANEQKLAFEVQMQWALERSMPICIHTRNAMQETIDMVKPFAKKGLRGVFHCFSGSYESAQQIINMGFYLGIGGVVTYKNAGIAEVVSKIDLEHLLLETDGPYLSPVPHRGKRNEPVFIAAVAQKIADCLETSVGEVASVTANNTKQLFNLPIDI
jgi:TatD DNase family protein